MGKHHQTTPVVYIKDQSVRFAIVYQRSLVSPVEGERRDGEAPKENQVFFVEDFL